MDENLQLFVRKEVEEEEVKTESLTGLVQVNHLPLKQLIQLTNTSFATPCTQNRRLLKYGDKKLVEIASKFATFSM